MPNIMKIRKCFLELRLEMSGMFFKTQCISWCDVETADNE